MKGEKMDLGLHGKVAIVSAASRGLGYAAAEALAREGAKLVIFSNNKENIKRASEKIRTITKTEVVPVVADLYDSETMNNVIEKAISEFGTIHILVTNAAPPPPGYANEIKNDDWIKQFEQIFLSAIKLINLSLPHMIQQNWSRIINILSVTVKQPIDNLTISNSLRLALAGFSKTLTLQVKGKNVTINNVAPGYIMTDRVKELIKIRAEKTGKSEEEVSKEISQGIPLGRIGKPEEFGNLIAFLASEKSSYINGATITIDGGLSLFPI